MPETVVKNCPETGEAKKKRGHLVRVYEMNWTPLAYHREICQRLRWRTAQRLVRTSILSLSLT